MTDRRRIGIVGARGYVGGELVRLVEASPHLELAFVGSRTKAGRPLGEVVAGAQSPLVFEDLSPEQIRERSIDALVLALPNGQAVPFCEGIAGVVVDMSADFRFDPDWAYGLPERFRALLGGARRIANPGCYATAAQLAIAPLKEELAAPPRIFGVSGHSGAGTTPSERNDPERLRDNLIPYSLAGHLHEREIAHHLAHPVHFMPHVAPFFRGITLTIDLELTASSPEDTLRERFVERYRDEPLVHVSGAAPLVRDIAGQHEVRIGGFTSEGRRVVLVATIDNLLKGAATQALQNLNLALGFDELLGIPTRNDAGGR